ncbi:hypothetical protein [Paracoccus aestuariivivens]|uniref:DUF4239 domain-containing protein n=1 Tax=Paracoccus aestuariivivens TaxID=1820333 RepID=A0A6L6JAT5_9RHOB|nr:hypothetical protein [Paracoccus aestuariivivens]MTH77071.1 hypothetical protein [Paracoccus aestuariivivens]
MPFLLLLEQNPLLFFSILLFGLIIFFELGVRIGRNRRKEIGEGSDEGATLVVGSVLGLLAFVLALNLSNASSRQENRMHSGLDEVNAIGTALMQAQAVGGDESGPIVAHLKKYLELRYRYIRAEPHSPEIAITTDESNQLQNEIWALLEKRVSENPTPAVTSLMNALNNAFDATTALRLMMEYRIPMQLIWLLLLMSLLGSGTVGYQFGLTGRKGRLPAIMLTVLWCTVVTAIIDIGSGRIWTFRTDARVYEWALDGYGIPRPPVAE